jgi:hypothetical protein
MFKHSSAQNIPVPNLAQITAFVFFLPGTSAPVEHVFSVMNNVWSLDRSQTDESTGHTLLHSKLNLGLTCKEFYDKITVNTKVLKKCILVENTHEYKKGSVPICNTKKYGNPMLV